MRREGMSIHCCREQRQVHGSPRQGISQRRDAHSLMRREGMSIHRTWQQGLFSAKPHSPVFTTHTQQQRRRQRRRVSATVIGISEAGSKKKKKKLQQPCCVCDFERWQHRMHVYLLDGVQWDDMQHLRRRLFFVPHLHTSRRGTTFTAVASVFFLHRGETAHSCTRLCGRHDTHMHWCLSLVLLPQEISYVRIPRQHTEFHHSGSHITGGRSFCSLTAEAFPACDCGR